MKAPQRSSSRKSETHEHEAYQEHRQRPRDRRTAPDPCASVVARLGLPGFPCSPSPSCAICWRNSTPAAWCSRQPTDNDLGLTGSDEGPRFSQPPATPLARPRMCRLDQKEGGIARCARPCCRSPSSSPGSRNRASRVITGNCAFTTEGLGITPGNQFSLIQCSEKPEESAILGSWFTSLWNTLPASDQQKPHSSRVFRHSPIRRPRRSSTT